MFLCRLSTDTLVCIHRTLSGMPEPLASLALVLRLRIREEIHHRACEAELTRRGFGRAPIEIGV